MTVEDNYILQNINIYIFKKRMTNSSVAEKNTLQ